MRDRILEVAGTVTPPQRDLASEMKGFLARVTMTSNTSGNFYDPDASAELKAQRKLAADMLLPILETLIKQNNARRTKEEFEADRSTLNAMESFIDRPYDPDKQKELQLSIKLQLSINKQANNTAAKARELAREQGNRSIFIRVLTGGFLRAVVGSVLFTAGFAAFAVAPPIGLALMAGGALLFASGSRKFIRDSFDNGRSKESLKKAQKGEWAKHQDSTESSMFESIDKANPNTKVIEPQSPQVYTANSQYATFQPGGNSKPIDPGYVQSRKSYTFTKSSGGSSSRQWRMNVRTGQPIPRRTVPRTLSLLSSNSPQAGQPGVVIDRAQTSVSETQVPVSSTDSSLGNPVASSEENRGFDDKNKTLSVPTESRTPVDGLQQLPEANVEPNGDDEKVTLDDVNSKHRHN